MEKGTCCHISNPISDVEKDLVGLQLVFQELEKHHGYAKVADSIGAIYWVHPESLSSGGIK